PGVVSDEAAGHARQSRDDLERQIFEDGDTVRNAARHRFFGRAKNHDWLNDRFDLAREPNEPIEWPVFGGAPTARKYQDGFLRICPKRGESTFGGGDICVHDVDA